MWAWCSGVSGMAFPRVLAARQSIAGAKVPPRSRATRGKTRRPVGCALTGNPYIEEVGQPTMAINGAWNKRCGPGGGTRRLHQFPTPPLRGVLWGRTRIDARGKGVVFRSAWYRRYRANLEVRTTIRSHSLLSL